MQRPDLDSLPTRLVPIKLRKESSSVRVQVGNTTIRVKLTSDQVRCDNAPRRVQLATPKEPPLQSSSRVRGLLILGL